ncbi:MAG: GTPase Era [Ruminococcus sp.]|nr:GTPase Era [Ruminococcus sp.]
MTKSAFVTIIGRANAGKSSLLNALVGEKIAAVSSKPQTTRTKITGVLTKGDTQFVFIDTPGMHKAKTKLSELMVKTINESVKNVELVIVMVDVTKNISDSETALINSVNSKNSKVVLCINKIDLVSKDVLIQKIAEYSTLFDFDEIIPISVLNNDGLDLIMDFLSKNAQEGPHYFSDDAITDQPEKVIIAEKIREKALKFLSDEVPHGIAVGIENVSEHDNKQGNAIMDIEAVIYCERESHKGIIIGKQGSMLKKIGQAAREELEDFFQIKVNLRCWVKVKEGWRNKEGLIKNFGLSFK